MKHGHLLLAFLLLTSISFAQSPADIRAYINQYKTLALEHEKLYGIPAPITLAQGLLESTAGTSFLAINANNHFGIKAIGWSGEIYRAWDDEKTPSKFRSYNSVEDSFEDHARIIKNGSRYQSLFNISVYDYRGWANGLQQAGYATSKSYAAAVIGYIDAYQLYNINGGVKLRPGKKHTLAKSTKVEDLAKAKDYVIEDEETTEEEEQLNHTLERFMIVAINDVRCTILYPGETLSSVAMRYNISKAKILEYNENVNESNIQEGDIVYLQKKKRKFSGTQDTYTVQPGDTPFSIAQQFGITTASLLRMNKKDSFTPLRDGEKLRLK